MVPLTSKRRQVQEGWWMAKQINLSVPIFHQISWHSILTYLNKRRWEQSNRHPPSQGRKAFCKRIKIYTRSKTKKAEPCSFINTTISTMALQPNGTSTHYGRLLYAVTGYSIIFPHTHTHKLNPVKMYWMSVLSSVRVWDLSLMSPPFVLTNILIAKSFKLIRKRDARMNIIWVTDPLKNLKDNTIKIAST